ncbi:HNH endonuclease [Terrabacter sp. 2RAF25]|uniref:HNH endonuclease n=1 Tax=Terrabacter sp. 2RAF25 TaxID=3232998 RepID=UPI003F9744D5
MKLTFQPGLFTGKGWLTLHVGVRGVYRLNKIHKSQWAGGWQSQMLFPLRLATVKNRTYWQFQGQFYSENEGLDGMAVHALLVTRQQRQSQRIDRAQQIVAMGGAPRDRAVREGIADDVKQFIWTRDGGACRQCGAVVELQFDHVIPLAMGGGTTPENLQILCGPCNRRKGASITAR